MFEVVTLNEKVDKQIEALPLSLRVELLQDLELLMEFGNTLGMPHSKSLGGGLFELRVMARDGIARAFYTFEKDRLIIILSVFVKKSQKTPQNEIERARELLKNLKGRK